MTNEIGTATQFMQTLETLPRVSVSELSAKSTEKPAPGTENQESAGIQVPGRSSSRVNRNHPGSQRTRRHRPRTSIDSNQKLSPVKEASQESSSSLQELIQVRTNMPSSRNQRREFDRNETVSPVSLNQSPTPSFSFESSPNGYPALSVITGTSNLDMRDNLDYEDEQPLRNPGDFARVAPDFQQQFRVQQPLAPPKMPQPLLIRKVTTGNLAARSNDAAKRSAPLPQRRSATEDVPAQNLRREHETQFAHRKEPRVVSSGGARPRPMRDEVRTGARNATKPQVPPRVENEIAERRETRPQQASRASSEISGR